MRYIFLAVTIYFAFSINIYGQISILGSDLPTHGKGFIVNVDSTTAISITAPSNATQTWSFLNLQNQSVKYAAYSQNNSYAPHYSNFTNANIYTFGYSSMYATLAGGLPLSATYKGYTYLKSDNTGLEIVGFCNDNLFNNTAVVENPTEVLIKTPFSYDSTYSGTTKWSYNFNQNPADYDTVFSSSMKKTLISDAFGYITTPYGTFEVIRIHENVITADSTFIQYLGVTYISTLLKADTINNYYFWAKDKGFPIAKIICDKQNNTKSIEYLAGTFNLYNLSGRVYSTDGTTPIESGTVSMIFKDVNNHLFDFYETIAIQSGGYFKFSDMPNSNFLVYADPNTTNYPYHVPTYYGDKIYWQDATIMNLNTDTIININLRNDSLQLQTPGNGQITGQITAFTYQKSMSVKADKIKVVLEEDPGGATKAHATVDDSGNYSIPNLNVGSYKVHVEIPGLIMTSIYNVEITTDSLIKEHLNYYYDTLTIFKNVYYGINPVFVDHNRQVEAMPNPFVDEINFVFSGDRFKTYQIEIYDLCGKLIYSTSGNYCSKVNISNITTKQGFYLYKVILDNKLSSAGKLIRY